MLNQVIGRILLSSEVLVSFAISMAIAIMLGLGIALIYRYTHRGMNYESSFLSTLVLLAPIVTLIMFFIQGDLVLSLGLVGSLSIIRFRTPIKDTRDMVFLFLSIAIGLGCGTLNWTLSVFAYVIIGLLMLIFHIIKYGKQLHAEYILIITGTDSFNDNFIKKFIDKKKINIQMRSSEYEGEKWEIVYELRFDKKHTDVIKDLVFHIQTLESVTKVSLLSPQLSLPM